MTAPNLINASSIIGKTSSMPVTTQTATLLSNPSASNKVIKVNTVYVSNDSTVSDARVTVRFVRETQSTSVITNSLVPVENTLVVISKEAPLYLEEGDSLEIASSIDDRLKAIISYETIE